MRGWAKELEELAFQVGLHYGSVADGSSDPDTISLAVEPYLLPQGRNLVRDVAAAGKARAADRQLKSLRKLDTVLCPDQPSAAEQYRAFIDQLRAELS